MEDESKQSAVGAKKSQTWGLKAFERAQQSSLGLTGAPKRPIF